MELIKWLQEWYITQCNGDWEHGHGIKITSIDNPGWHVAIALVETELENKEMDSIRILRTEEDWINCKIENGYFSGAGGPAILKRY